METTETTPVPGKISIGRALTRVSKFDEQFKPTYQGYLYTDVIKNGKSVSTGVSDAETKTGTAANLQSARDVIEANFQKRLAIAESNIKTEVTVTGRKFTVAGAILYRTYAIPRLKELLAILTTQSKNVATVYTREVRVWEEFIKDKNPDELELYKKSMEPSVYNITDVIESLTKEILEFETEVDALLTESNAITLIDL